MLRLILALSGKNSSCLTFCLRKNSGGMQLLLPFLDTWSSQLLLSDRMLYDLEADGFRGDTLFRAKIIY